MPCRHREGGLGDPALCTAHALDQTPWPESVSRLSETREPAADRVVQDPLRGECFARATRADTQVLAGNATIGREILEDLPDVAAVLVPFGGGGLSVGIAAGIHASVPGARIYACETEAGTPVAAAFAAGRPVRVDFDPSTFITGMGSSVVLAPMWPLIRAQLAGTRCSTCEQVARAIKLLLLEHHVVAEGAGAASVAAALEESEPSGPTVCIVSGGHLDLKDLADILEDRMPRRLAGR